MFTLSEESKDRISWLIELSRNCVHYGYLPLILYIGVSRHACLLQSMGILYILTFLPYYRLHTKHTKTGFDQHITIGINHSNVVGGTYNSFLLKMTEEPLRQGTFWNYTYSWKLTRNYFRFSVWEDSLPRDDAQVPLIPLQVEAGHMDERQHYLSPAVIETVAGLTAGSVSTLVVHPLDIVKTRMQIHRSLAAPNARPTTTWNIMQSLVCSSSPLRTMYRGVSVNLVGNAASWGGFFYFKTHIERSIAAIKGRANRPSSHSYKQVHTMAIHEQLDALDFFTSSMLSGAIVAVLTNPLWVLKTRLLSSDRTTKGAYPGFVKGALRMWKEEGLRGGYKGLAISMVGVAHGAVHFAVYEPVKNLYYSWKRHQAQASQQLASLTSTNDKISNQATLVISSLAKLVANVATYPYQVIRSRLQNYNAEDRFGRGISGVTARLWREEGLRGFYRGLTPGVIRMLPSTWVTFLVYENLKHLMIARNESSEHNYDRR